MTADQGHDGYRGQLNRQCVTIPEVMRPAGYRTYMCGKWHVCRNIRQNGDKSDWPVQRGFEKFYGTITGGGSYYDPTSLCRQNTFVTPENDPEYNHRISTTPTPSRITRFAFSPTASAGRQASVLFLCCLHRGALADARVGRTLRHRPI
jgi:arylsulfatase A-like enzyme